MPLPSLVPNDGRTLFTRHWPAAGSPRATVALLHGYAEHSGRYEHVADAFAEVGAETYAMDLRGHGRSEGRRAYVDSFEQYLDDLDLFLDAVRSSTPERPLFLFGHSMGGLICLSYVLDRSPSLRGLLLSAPAIEVNPDLASWLRPVARLLGWLVPTLPTVRSPQGTISRDPEVVAHAKRDPLNYHGRVQARLGAELLRAGTEIQARLSELNTPFLVIHGTADRLASPQWSQRLYDRAAADDKTIRLYEGLYHETFNEPERETVLQDLQRWVEARSPDAPATA